MTGISWISRNCRYREASDIIKKGKLCSLFINDLDAGALFRLCLLRTALLFMVFDDANPGTASLA